jgi:N-acetylglucosaminyldiphosphoundecaprenol N-acetyl-beta-D-mannosaminyltransferase
MPAVRRLSPVQFQPLHDEQRLATANENRPQGACDLDLSREIYGVLGVPVDAIGLNRLLQKLGSAVGEARPFLISTPNTNFLVESLSNSRFRQSLVMSDLCLVDGMPIVWVARMLGIPIEQRIAGSDLFNVLKAGNHRTTPLKVFLFGGADGVAEVVAEKLRSQVGGLQCVGALNPGFGSAEDISSEEIIRTINESKADLLAVFLGASKGQEWLLRNHHAIKVPLRAHFGATINFEAGRIKRAPLLLQRRGLEWLWRIKEEPHLWRRYWSDGLSFLYLLLTSALPIYLARNYWIRNGDSKVGRLVVKRVEDEQCATITLSGDLTADHAHHAIPYLREAVDAGKHVVLDLSDAHRIDARFFGLFLVLRKELSGHDADLRFTGVSRQTRRDFRLNRFDFLLTSSF